MSIKQLAMRLVYGHKVHRSNTYHGSEAREYTWDSMCIYIRHGPSESILRDLG